MANEDEQDESVEMTEQEQQQTPARRAAQSRRDDAQDDDPAATKAELERTRAALSKANKEAAANRHRLAELERVEQERADASLSEAERIRKEAKDAREAKAESDRRAADAEDALERLKIDMAVERMAAQMNFIYPDIAPSLIDRRRVSIDEETGRPTGIKEALERLLKDKPDLAYAAPRGGTPSREGPSRSRAGLRDRQPTDVEAELRATRNYTS